MPDLGHLCSRKLSKIIDLPKKKKAKTKTNMFVLSTTRKKSNQTLGGSAKKVLPHFYAIMYQFNV